jgi:hypothetical protein
MDDKLVPMMAILLALLVVWVVAAGYGYWRARRRVAWNVVLAALTRRHLQQPQVAAVDAAASDILADLRMQPEAFARAPAAVRFAVDSMAMRRLGIAPFGGRRAFSALRSPHLARSVAQHIRVVRFHVENEHNLRLTELDRPAATPP